MKISHSQVYDKVNKVWPPPIPWLPKTKMKATKSEDDKDAFVTVKVRLNPDDEDSSMFLRKLRIFESGTPEDWVKWRMDISEFFKEAKRNDIEEQHNTYRSLLRGKPKEWLTACFNSRHVTNGQLNKADQLDYKDLLDMVINDVTKKMFDGWETSARRQKGWMRKNLTLGDADPEEWADRLLTINSYLPFFPHSDTGLMVESLPEDALIDILDDAKKADWHYIMLSQGRRPELFSNVQEAVAYYNQLYTADRYRSALEKSDNADNGERAQRDRGKRGRENHNNKKDFKNNKDQPGKHRMEKNSPLSASTVAKLAIIKKPTVVKIPKIKGTTLPKRNGRGKHLGTDVTSVIAMTSPK